MKWTLALVKTVIGIAFIVIGLYLSLDFIVKFGIAAIGVFLIMIGVGLIAGRK
ncbi:MAG TPA: hypothetical protein VJI75_05895 [Candidatus Nanoarchaeia archaeon]|nr:hypothetical protein [Candidatus Nanoarchaeia archaeon]